MGRYQVIVSGPTLIDDMRKAPLEEISLRGALAEVRRVLTGDRSRLIFLRCHVLHKFFQAWYTVGYKDDDNLYHFGVIRGALTKNIEDRFSEMHDEIVTACDEIFALKGNGVFFVTLLEFSVLCLQYKYCAEWSKVLALHAILHIVCRAASRYSFGLPVC
jgi:hypothetical protein